MRGRARNRPDPGLDRSKNRASVRLVRAIRRFTVRPVLPEALAALGELAGNLRWSWHPPTQDVFAEVDPELWESTGRDPVRLLGAVEPGPARGAGRRRRLPRAARRGAAPTSTAYLTGTAGTSSRAATEQTGPRRSATSRPSSASPPCCRSTPAASASSPATTSRRPATSASRSSASGCSTGTATSSSRCPARAGSRRPTRSSTPTGCRSRCCASPTASRATIAIALPGGPPLVARIWVASVGRVPLLMLDTDVEGNPDALRRRHRPALRRQQRAPAAPGAAARRRRRPRAARLLAGSPAHPAPEVFHTNEGHAGFLGLERIRELTVAEGGPKRRLRHRARGGPRLHGVHHPHAGARRHRPLPARRWSSSTSATPAPPPACRSTGSSRSAPRTTRAATPTVFNMAVMGFRLAQRANGVSQLHGAGQPRHVQRPVAGLRRGRGADRLDHQRRARADLGGPRGLRARRRARAPTPTPTTPRRSGRRSTRCPAADIWAVKRQLRERLVLDARRRLRESWQERGAAPGRARLDRHRARPRRADHRVRPPRAVVQAADADAARPRAAQAPAAAPRAARSSWSSPARRTRPTTAARS